MKYITTISVLIIVLIAVSSLPAAAQEYRSYDQVLSALSQLETSRPDIAKTFDIGTSWGGRIIRAVKISDHPAIEDPTEDDVLLTGVHHAREWISVEVPLRIAEYLVANYEDAAIKPLVDNREIWIVPLVNPDGYQHSHAVDRLWRKNRRDLAFGFFGVDLNRNYAYQWGVSGSSAFLGSPIYRGPNAFSEPETVAIRDLIESHNFISLISYHSYTQAILYPWGYTGDAAPDEPLLRSIAERMRDLIQGVHGEDYCVGQPQACIGYVASGDLTDWAYAEKGILSYTIELRPKTADPGFSSPRIRSYRRSRKTCRRPCS